MKLGINVPNFGPEASPEALLDWAHFAEEHGFAIAMMSDHVAPTPEVEALYRAPFFDTFTTLAWLAGQTRHLLVGTTIVVLPYRHPLQTARMSATLDRLSAGRFVLGVGVGWAESEFSTLGVPFRKRGQITSEYLDVLTNFWRAGVATYVGDSVSFRDISTGPAPVRGTLPIWVGGMGRAGIDRAARYGDAWHPNNPDPDWLESFAIPSLAQVAAAVGRAAPDVAPRIKFRPTDSNADPERPLGVGSPAQILADLRRLEGLGCSYVILDPNPDHPVARDYARERDELAHVIDAFTERA